MVLSSFVRISPGSNPKLSVGLDNELKVVLLSHKADRSDEIWRLQPLEGFSGSLIIHQLTNKCLSWLELGGQVIVADACRDIPEHQQVWALVSEVENNSSIRRICSGKDSSVSLECSVAARENSSVLASSWEGKPSQQWIVTDLSFKSIYPTPLASHEEVLADPNLFLKTLGAFHEHFGSLLKIPLMGAKELNLHILYTEVTARGGFTQVVQQRTWKDVVHIFGFPPTLTNSSFVLRKYYFNLLFHYEQVYFSQKQGFLVPSPTGIPPPVDDTELNETNSDGKAAKKKKRRPKFDIFVPPEGDPSRLVGQMVTGSIYGKFDYGFLVSVQVGPEKLTGVLYHAPKGGKPHPTALANQSGEDQKKKRKRRSNLSKKDPLAPKSHRSGYNFFFQEWRKRLKEENPAMNDRECTSKIGEKWTNLPEEGRVPYQEMAMADKDRYLKELESYRESTLHPPGPSAAAAAAAPSTEAMAWISDDLNQQAEGADEIDFAKDDEEAEFGDVGDQDVLQEEVEEGEEEEEDVDVEEEK